MNRAAVAAFLLLCLAILAFTLRILHGEIFRASGAKGDEYDGEALGIG